jgi:prepilin-type processing-associated H-X9-DG protein
MNSLKAWGLEMTVKKILVPLAAAIGASVLVVAIVQYTRKPELSPCLLNLQKMGKAISQYCAANGNQMPTGQRIKKYPWNTAWQAISRYSETSDIFHCPDDSILGLNGAMCYFYHSGSGSTMTSQWHTTFGGLPNHTVVAYCIEHLQGRVIKLPDTNVYQPDVTDDGRYIGYFNVLYADGSVGKLDGAVVQIWKTDGKEWRPRNKQNASFISNSEVDRFPSDPWPPQR